MEARKVLCIEYTANNSGGSWWLSDKNWRDLEKRGWKVLWNSHCHTFDEAGEMVLGADGLPVFRKSRPGDLRHGEGGRWLGALAMYAYRAGYTEDQAKREFQEITGQDPDEAGCPCCGQPHSFVEVLGG